ncbi:MAG: hypothetical protein Q8S84_04215 [bacterium]|nr:hypothetical protein [bacterium]
MNTFQLLGAKSTILPLSNINILSSLKPVSIAVFLCNVLKYKSQNIGIKYFGLTNCNIIFCSS